MLSASAKTVSPVSSKCHKIKSGQHRLNPVGLLRRLLEGFLFGGSCVSNQFLAGLPFGFAAV